MHKNFLTDSVNKTVLLFLKKFSTKIPINRGRCFDMIILKVLQIQGVPLQQQDEANNIGTILLNALKVLKDNSAFEFFIIL